ncbi:MAG TPA: methyl-accepting chemotaxis protein, partial [Burkholderiaceae bacterium]|nr:methyl-accepting chemotaxis protein [Burkholderiaceae bacterium]
EAAAASEAMQDQAGKLAQVVAVFQLAGGQARAPATPLRTITPTATPAMGGGPRAVATAPKQVAPAKRLAAAQGSPNDEWEQF